MTTEAQPADIQRSINLLNKGNCTPICLKLEEAIMNRPSLMWIIVLCSFFLVGSAATTTRAHDCCAVKVAQATEQTPKIAEKDREEWAQLQNRAQKDYRICIEHCGNEVNCMSRCEQFLQSRLDRDYQKLILK
jgi:hypothetical protein